MIDNEDMITSAIDPLILEIYLYNNNYKDRLLISELKEKAYTVRVPELEGTSFFIRVDDMYEILNTKFKKDLRDFESTPYENLEQSVTSIFLLSLVVYSVLDYPSVFRQSSILFKWGKSVLHGLSWCFWS
jgi:hypothetical protein